MVLTRGQQAGDPSPANPDRYPISTGNPMVAPTSNNASGITASASGDAHGSAWKPVHGSQSGRLASTLTSTHQLGAQARLSASTNRHQTAPANGYSSSPVSSGPHTPDSDSASATRYDTQGPRAREPLEVQREPIMVTRQLPDTTGAPQVRPRDTHPRTAPVNGNHRNWG